jgi:pimeloyl-ACP methyl ester carboxylesterase
MPRAFADAVEVEGARVHFSSAGRGPNTVILVHGWTCDETVWRAQVPALAADHRVITIDLPGHGRSGGPRDGVFSFDLFARAIEAVRGQAQAGRAVLVGHSMGAPVVVQYARLYPQVAIALVLADGVVRQRRSHPAEAFGGPGGMAVRENLIRGMFSPATAPALRSRILSLMLDATEATAVGAMKALSDESLWQDHVMHLPVLAIFAERSRFADRAAMEVRCRDLEYVEIPGAGHFLMMEKPDEFNRLLLDFLRRRCFQS